MSASSSSVSSVSSAASSSSSEVTYSIEDSAVLAKYRAAGEVAKAAMQFMIDSCVAGASVKELCVSGDEFILNEVAGVFSKQKGLAKGIAFPVCVSVNECVGHNSPLASAEEETLQEGDAVKIDLGVHIDGCPVMVAHTLVVGASAEAPVTGDQANVMQAAWTASQVVMRMLKKPNMTNTQMTEAIASVAEAYGVSPMEGVLSHEMDRWIIDGKNVIMNKTTIEQKVEEFEVEDYKVFSIDIVMSSGEGKPREVDARTTIFKRDVDVKYKLKSKNARWAFALINKNYPTLPFTIRAVGDETKVRVGVREMLEHSLLQSYPVLFEHNGVAVAHVKTTVAVLKNGNLQVLAMSAYDQNAVQTDLSLPEGPVADIMTRPLIKKKKNKKKKKKKN